MATDPIALRQRLLTREQAAFYCGLSVSAFSRWVKIGRLPAALGGTSRWDLKAIDLALDSLSGLAISKTSDSATIALDDWREKRARRSEGNS
jgi:predicted DNA-binding transcriptional regulator AlpA